VNPTEFTATDLAAAIRRREISASETVEAHLEAISAAEHLNAFTSIEAEQALTRAGLLDDALSAGRDPGPLHGVPVALKDLIDHAGRVTTAGSSFYRHLAEVSAPVVTRLEAAGAIVIGRTGLHEFAFGFSSENDWFGPVRNPWDPSTSPGGSSGGSASAVAAHLAPIGIGTDTGGSVRVPAALCGIVGLKVTHGRVPITGVFPLAPSLDTVGPITRSVADAALTYSVIAGDDHSDPWCAPRPVTTPDHPADLSGLRVAVPRQWLDRPLSLEVRTGFERALDRIAGKGATVVHVDTPDIVRGAFEPATYGEVAFVHSGWFLEDSGRYGEEIRARLGHTIQTDQADFARARTWREGLRHSFERVFAEFDIIATPMTAVTRKIIGEEFVVTEAGTESYRPALSAFSVLANQAGLPAISLPIDAAGSPPPSIQPVHG